MARQVLVEILGNAKQYIATTAEADLASSRLGAGLGKTGSAAKNLENDLTGMSKSAAGSIPVLGRFGGSIAGFPIPLLAAAAAAAGLYVAGKSIVDISDKWEAAQLGLAQATTIAGVSNDKARQFVDNFIGSNKRFVNSQVEVVDSYAQLTRSGLAQKEVQRDLNIALDLSALKHISLSEATDLVNKAEHGRMRGLIDLGIVTKNMVDAQGNLIGGTKSIAAAMDALEAKTRRGREATSELTQASNHLGNIWQSFAERTGPVLNKVLASAVKQFAAVLETVLKVFDAIGWLIARVQSLISWLGKIKMPNIDLSGIASTAHTLHIPGFDAGGVVPGAYGSPQLVMARGGETFGGFPPPGGRGNITINLYATVADGPALDTFTNAIAQRLGYATGL